MALPVRLAHVRVERGRRFGDVWLGYRLRVQPVHPAHGGEVALHGRRQDSRDR